jgi:glycogen synthase
MASSPVSPGKRASTFFLGSGRREPSKRRFLVVLGNGEYELEQRCEALRRDFPNTMGIYIGYNNELAHKIYGAAIIS